MTKLMQELAAETTLEDIPDQYREIVKITGIDTFIRISEYARGDQLYFPKVESVTAPARNRRIQKEYNGYNTKDLAAKYNLTIQHVWKILKNIPSPEQMDIFDWAKTSGKQF